MTALINERNTPRRDGARLDVPVKGATTIFAGALAVSDAGYAAPGRTAPGLVALGRCEATVVAQADGDAKACIRPGTFRFENSSGADLITQAAVGGDCYIVDDQTVALTSGSATRSRAGVVVDVDDVGVWVQVGPGL